MFIDLFFPVVVCKKAERYPVEYMNIQARMLFSPNFSADGLSFHEENDGFLRDIFKEQSETSYKNVVQLLEALGRIDNHSSEVTTFEGDSLPVSVSAVTVKLDFGEYVVFYLTLLKSQSSNLERSIISLINTAFTVADLDHSINSILALTGEMMNVDRVYIFESISSTHTRNTYEWCASEIEPAISDLQHLAKADYNYEEIVKSGMLITDDVKTLSVEDGREILEMQGIKALAILTFYDNKEPLGYIGYDDTKTVRKWCLNEIQYLKSVSTLIAILIKRRKAEEASRRTLNILQILSDSSNDLIYVNSIDDYTIKFVSRSLAEALGKTPQELIGKICWQELTIGQTDVCSYCPIPKIGYDPETGQSTVYEWEHKNLITEHTYLIKDNLVRWVDGQLTHIETATDITMRIEQEEKLKILASTDSSTGVFNRQWGGNLLEELLSSKTKAPLSLCFCDLDGLKNVNDTYGHNAGDVFILGIINTIKSRLDEKEIICRWGGDEFLILVYGDTSYAEKKLLLVQDDLEKINESGIHPFKLSISYGIVPFKRHDNESLDSIVTEADSKMYNHKMGKRGRLLHRRRSDPTM